MCTSSILFHISFHSLNLRNVISDSSFYFPFLMVNLTIFFLFFSHSNDLFRCSCMLDFSRFQLKPNQLVDVCQLPTRKNLISFYFYEAFSVICRMEMKWLDSFDFLDSRVSYLKKVNESTIDMSYTTKQIVCKFWTLNLRLNSIANFSKSKPIWECSPYASINTLHSTFTSFFSSFLTLFFFLLFWLWEKPQAVLKIFYDIIWYQHILLPYSFPSSFFIAVDDIK